MNLADLSSPAVVCLPDLARRDAFTVAGPTRRFDAANAAAIPQLWPTLLTALPLAGQTGGWISYGLTWGYDPATGGFDYMPGVAVEPGTQPPAGFSLKQVAAASYVVFSITLGAGDLHLQVKSAMAAIWGVLLPASGLRVAEGPSFEYYDGRFQPGQPGSVLEFHVPVLPPQG
ncbi:hypothetical protein GT347_24540 [Xylophilus rhododendri]|uniref:AraC effector-binding domain-containing protein n=1 Tax=Xylophilus rhododendri TaxID=2697032 RepID=A0A857JDX3_9BURK|nr:GyrI-like domain-containing protein [Xylophilus rhododendri]QHJ00876.1 hypothetical protein GT347_24540 [Xylophilus rhododendri]